MTANVARFYSHDNELRTLHDALETRLDQLLPSGAQQDQVCAAMRAGALAPGKRIRPLLLLLTAYDLGFCQQKSGLVDLACAVEIVHAASLILDDTPFMDNALLRRGQPTVHRQFGESTAVLATVALLSRSFGIIALAEGLSEHCKNLAIAELSRAVGLQGLVQGQYRDLQEGSDPQRSAEAILTTNELKTSVLFDASLQIAAIAAGATPQVRETLRGVARELGQAFQLLDDLFDGFSHTGKDLHQDQGKATLISRLGRQAVQQRLRTHLRNADDYLSIACQHGIAAQRFMHDWFNKQLAMLDQTSN